MNVWIKQRHNKLFDSYRIGRALREGDRVIVLCPESDNELINCSQAFFDAEIAKGRLVFDNPHQRTL